MHTDQEVSRAYDLAPKAIQDALSDGPAVDFMVNLQSRYGLHVDVAGSIVSRIRDLLLGLANPTEFLGELIQLGLTDTVARAIVADLNKEVFVPLREAMRNAPEEPKAAVEPISVPQQSLSPKETVPAPTLAYEPRPAPVTLPGSPVEAPMPAAPASLPTYSVPESAPVAPSVPHPAYPAPSAPQPGWHSAAAVHIYVPSHGVPFEQMHTPVPIEAKEIAPVTAPLSSAPTPVPQAYVPAPAIAAPEPVSAPIPAATTLAPAPITKDYAADPYREPI